MFPGCYGVDGESDSIMSSASENSTEPWFCDACKNGVTPSCELCPNQDGIFKETDAGRWDTVAHRPGGQLPFTGSEWNVFRNKYYLIILAG